MNEQPLCHVANRIVAFSDECLLSLEAPLESVSRVLINGRLCVTLLCKEGDCTIRIDAIVCICWSDNVGSDDNLTMENHVGHSVEDGE